MATHTHNTPSGDCRQQRVMGTMYYTEYAQNPPPLPELMYKSRGLHQQCPDSRDIIMYTRCKSLIFYEISETYITPCSNFQSQVKYTSHRVPITSKTYVTSCSNHKYNIRPGADLSGNVSEGYVIRFRGSIYWV